MDILGLAHQRKVAVQIRTNFRITSLNWPRTDMVSSCVRGFATPYKLERTSLAIAGVRRLLLFHSNETDKPRHVARSRFPGRTMILQAIFDTRCRSMY